MTLKNLLEGPPGPPGPEGPEGPPGPGFVLSVVTVTQVMSPYTITTQNVVYVDCSAGNVTIVLPSAATAKQIFFSRIDNTPLYVGIISRAGSDTIIGSTTYLLQWQYQSNVLISNGATKWSLTSRFDKNINPFTLGYLSWINMFEIINDPYVIAAIQADNLTGGYLDAYFAAANAIGGMIFFPKGGYHLNGTFTPSAGVEFVGAGEANTIIYTGGATWGIELLLPNGTQHIEAPKFRDLQFQIATTAGNGIRMNSSTGGFTDDNTSQQYMMRPRFERCTFARDTANYGIGLQLNKCFDFLIRSCTFKGFDYAIDFEGSDSGELSNSRFDETVTYDIIAHARGTFGSGLVVWNNDFNNPAVTNVNGGFIETTYRDISIYDNHMELDTGVTRVNLIKVSGLNAFDTKIHNNRIEPGGLCTNWLSVNTDNNHYLVSVHNNVTESAVATMGSVSWGDQYYFNNSGGRCIVSHGGNTVDASGFPMNFESGDLALCGANVLVNVTASRPGIAYVGLAPDLKCNSGSFKIAANADSTKYMQVSDWSSLQLPANVMKGTFDFLFTTYADVAGQELKWEALDNGVSVISGTIVHANANQIYTNPTTAGYAFATNLQLRVWNEDVGHGDHVYIMNIAIRNH